MFKKKFKVFLKGINLFTNKNKKFIDRKLNFFRNLKFRFPDIFSNIKLNLSKKRKGNFFYSRFSKINLFIYRGCLFY